MRMSLPAVVRGNGDMLFGVGADIPRGNLVLFLYIDFAIKDRDIHGFIALVMDLPSIVALKAIVHDFVHEIGRQAAGNAR